MKQEITDPLVFLFYSVYISKLGSLTLSGDTTSGLFLAIPYIANMQYGYLKILLKTYPDFLNHIALFNDAELYRGH